MQELGGKSCQFLNKSSAIFSNIPFSVKTKNFYKTMIKPGAISSQSFVQTFDNCGASIKSGLGAAEKQAARFNSQTPRNDFTSPENQS